MRNIEEVLEQLIPTTSKVDANWDKTRQAMIDARDAEIEPYDGPLEAITVVEQSERLKKQINDLKRTRTVFKRKQ